MCLHINLHVMHVWFLHVDIVSSLFIVVSLYHIRIKAGQYWNLLSRYIMAKSITVLLYIMIYYFFLSLRPILQYSTGYINSYTLHEVYIQNFKQPSVIKSM